MNNLKYVIEDNLDFKTAMMDVDVDEAHICLISQQPLTKSHIKLPCMHTFNYMSLYKEVHKQKLFKNAFEPCKLKINQLKCPYCRTVIDQLLPYIAGECADKICGVNYPLKYCMKNVIECDWVNKSTNHKCVKTAHFIDNLSYCKAHYKRVTALNQTPDPAPAPNPTVIWTPAMDHIYKSKKIVELKQLLKLHNFKVGGNKRDLVERIFEKNLNIVFN